MDETKRERLEAALHLIERRWGPQTVVPASAAPSHLQGILTSFAALDQILGAGGVPLQAITLISGSTTCGKLTLAYKILAQAQNWATQRGHSVAILDLGASTDADYLMRCGVDLDRLLLVRPESGKQATRVLLDLVRSRELRAILVDSLPDLVADPHTARALDQIMHQVNLALKGAGCALIVLEEIQPPWLPTLPGWTSRAVAHYAALHMELVREGWIESERELVGYRAQVRIVRRQGLGRGRSAPIAIEFGETVRARETW